MGQSFLISFEVQAGNGSRKLYVTGDAVGGVGDVLMNFGEEHVTALANPRTNAATYTFDVPDCCTLHHGRPNTHEREQADIHVAVSIDAERSTAALTHDEAEIDLGEYPTRERLKQVAGALDSDTYDHV